MCLSKHCKSCICAGQWPWVRDRTLISRLGHYKQLKRYSRQFTLFGCCYCSHLEYLLCKFKVLVSTWILVSKKFKSWTLENVFVLSGNLGLGFQIFCRRLQYIYIYGKNNKIVVCDCLSYLSYMWCNTYFNKSWSNHSSYSLTGLKTNSYMPGYFRSELFRCNLGIELVD